MAQRKTRAPFGPLPEILRFDLRLTGAHPGLRAWAYKRPYVGINALKTALESAIELEGEEGLDRLLAALSQGAPPSSQARRLEGKAKAAAHSEPAPNIGEPAPNIGEQAKAPEAPTRSAQPPAREPSSEATAPQPPEPARQAQEEVRAANTSSPVDALTNLAANALRETRERNAAALLSNDRLFGGTTKG